MQDYFPVMTRDTVTRSLYRDRWYLKMAHQIISNLIIIILFGEIEFIQANDTLYISKKKDIRFVVAQDTFFYDNGLH